ncbi:MAG: hypothetical protein NZZ41_02220 [Candidatus Dojkabacteria bacterium]|nr:hypothetical protein [Candidatus Dojkabacteria bacterium]
MKKYVLAFLSFTFLTFALHNCSTTGKTNWVVSFILVPVCVVTFVVCFYLIIKYFDERG